MKTIKFYTLGCKVNQYDTQSIRERFLRCGFKELEDGKPADIYIINTCTVTQQADARSFSLIRKAKKENPRAKVIVTGCLAELDENKIKNIDKRALVLRKDKLITHNSELITSFKDRTRAFLKVQDGCNNFCSYCKVPLVRGSSRSKPLENIIQEAEQLVKNGFTPLETKGRQKRDMVSLTGFKEIVLSGICLGSYGKDLSPQFNLADVIEALENIEGLLRIRLSSLEMFDISEALINKMIQGRKLCRHLHIPLQSGDDKILKDMQRSYSGADYLNLVQRIKKLIPEIAITTDVLVGFPGEKEAHFQNTLDLIKETLPLKVHIFPYSPREGTQAFNFQDRPAPDIVKQRISQLKWVAQHCSLIYKKQFLNKNMAVLVEAQCKENKGFWEGYTDNYIKVFIKSNQNLKNQLISIKLKESAFLDSAPFTYSSRTLLKVQDSSILKNLKSLNIKKVRGLTILPLYVILAPMDILKQLNWIDIFVIILLFRIGYIALKNGLPTEFFKLLGNLSAIYLSLHYYTALSDWIRNRIFVSKEKMPLEFLDFICFVVLAILGYIIFVALRQALSRFIKMQAGAKLNKWGSLTLGIMRSFLLSSLIVYTLVISSISYLKNSALNSYSGIRLFKLAPSTYSRLWNGLVSKFMNREKFNSTVLEVQDSLTQK